MAPPNKSHASPSASKIMSNLLSQTDAFRLGELPINNYISNLQFLFEEREPSVLSFIPEENRFERLRKDAEELVSRFPDSKNRPPLFGLLVGVKDIFRMDGFKTQAGSRLPSAELQGKEAESVTRLKNAGALILGKTVTTEFAYFTPGPTRNPHNPAHTPGGSSSGSAAAVGAGLCPLALGTQTIGSLIRPAAFCGVVGFKPTYERLSRDGVIPLSPSLDHIGFFTPDVETAKKVASVLMENWRIRDWTLRQAQRGGLETGDSRPVLGIPEGPYLESASGEGLAHFENVCKLLSTHYQIRRVRVMDDYQVIRSRHDVIMSFDAANVHKEWFSRHEILYSSKFSDLIKRGQRITNSQLQTALQARESFRNQITQTMTAHNIDLWICPPAIGPAPKGLDSTGDPVMCLPWTQIGSPAINLPAGKSDDGLPMGLQVIGKWNMDEELLAWAEDLEKIVSKS
ncbi:MAG: amidase [Chloroflexi bacterium]|nr:amidase [Chloroflexota bacterium]